jgi:magnesium-transporting ATPase (P-type)
MAKPGELYHTGLDTELGKINQMISDVEEITTPLLQQIEKFGKWLSVIIIGITGLFRIWIFFQGL